MEARKLIFGEPDNNVAYAMFVWDELQREGHHVVLEFKSRKEIIRQMEKIVIADKMNCRKEHQLEPLLAHETMLYHAVKACEFRCPHGKVGISK